MDETGAELPQTLENKIYQWLEEPVLESPTTLLLGEFGDGKTFFTYVLTRKLAEKFLQSPRNEWLPVRFALRNFESEGFQSIQNFLQHRLRDFGADVAGWNKLRRDGYKMLVILDGFDEISKKLDPETIQRNILRLVECYESDYFNGLKMLITSRKHFFENYEEKEWLLDKLDHPKLLHMAPISRPIREKYLRQYAVEIGEEEKFNKLKGCHDPIGMAAKPLFLDMVQASLKDLPEENLNEYSLYETYIQKALERKEKYLYDKQMKTKKAEIKENLLKALELVAQKLHQTNQEFIYLSDIRANSDVKQWLWDLSELDENITEDEMARTATRSLLERAKVNEPAKGKKWAVDFCYRSMREYFVARAVCNMVENNLEEAVTFLIGCPLSYEILFFAGEIMKHRAFEYESHLLELIEKTRNVEDIDRAKLCYLGGNTINLLYRYKDKLPTFDWRNLVLDYAILPGADLSGKDFSKTSFQYANLDNVNFNGSNFTECNFTKVRIEETAPVQSIVVSPGEKILALYHDGIIRVWDHKRPGPAVSTTLSGTTKEKGLKLFAQPGSDLTILNDRYLFFCEILKNQLEQKSAIEIKTNYRLLKASRDYLLLNADDGKKNRILLVDLNKQAVAASFSSFPAVLSDHLGCYALVVYTEKGELKIIDVNPAGNGYLDIPTGEKVTCLSVYGCKGHQDRYLLGVGLYTGAVQVWQIDVPQWKSEKLLEHSLHEQKKPVKDIAFIDECRIVTGGLDKAIKMFTFNERGKVVGKVKEFKMTLQCRGMKVNGMIRDKEQQKLLELIKKAAQFS